MLCDQDGETIVILSILQTFYTWLFAFSTVSFSTKLTSTGVLVRKIQLLHISFFNCVMALILTRAVRSNERDEEKGQWGFPGGYFESQLCSSVCELTLSNVSGSLGILGDSNYCYFLHFNNWLWKQSMSATTEAAQ